MDLKIVVFNVVWDGKFWFFIKLLVSKFKEEVFFLIFEKINGVMLFLMVVRYGYFDMVEFFLEQCSVFIEVGGFVNFDGEIIEGVFFLWVVFVVGYLKVVQFLLNYGVFVNNVILINLIFF